MKRKIAVINSQTKLFCLIGKPAAHSLSPLIHNTGFEEFGVNAVYLVFEPSNLQKTIEGLKEIGVSGFNVTMPFKEKILKELDKIDENAKKIGAVNTVVNEKGKLVGYNTDGLGAMNAILKKTNLTGKRILVLGAGGAATAIVQSIKGGIVDVAARNKKKAFQLASVRKGKGLEINQISSLHQYDILINATPVGMKPQHKKSPIQKNLLHKDLVVFDLVYNPLKTKLLQDAKKKGCITISGVEMLLEQGFIGFKLFTGKDAPEAKIRKAFLKKMEEL